MKAARFHRTGPPEVLQVEDVPRPEVLPGEVLVRVEAGGLNFADVGRRRGDYHPYPLPLPTTAGAEVVGVVESVGEGLDRSLVGTRVFGFSFTGGAFAEYVAIPARTVYPVPVGLEADQAVALFLQGLTAALMLRQPIALRPGESVFIEAAAGGVGSLLVQLARLWGAGTVIAGAGNEEKRARARALGADHTVDYRAPGWAERVVDLTQGRGVDVAFNMAGADAFEQCLDCVAMRGRVVVFGSADGGPPPTLNIGQLFSRCVTVTPFLVPPFLEDSELVVQTIEELAALVRDNRLRVHIGGRYALEDIAVAHRDMESGRTVGKLVVVPQR